MVITFEFTPLLGIGLIASGAILIAFSRYRAWLVFMLAGMLFWTALEMLRFSIQYILNIGLLQAYIGAFLLSLVGITIAILIKDHQHRKNSHNKVNCIEHTPVYDEDPHTLSR